jgi:hypothetical protein
MFRQMPLRITEAFRGVSAFQWNRIMSNKALAIFLSAVFTSATGLYSAEGVECEAFVVPLPVVVQARGNEKTLFLIAMKLENSSSHTLVFSKYNTPTPKLTSISGKPLKTLGGSDVTRMAQYSDFVLLRPRESTFFTMEATARYSAGKVTLSGNKADGGAWSIRDVQPGTYKMRLVYYVPDSTLPKEIAKAWPDFALWSGEVATNPILLEIQKTD